MLDPEDQTARIAENIKKAAERAKAEAEERRRKEGYASQPLPEKEINGPKGAEPSRFGDWERKGIAYDF